MHRKAINQLHSLTLVSFQKLDDTLLPLITTRNVLQSRHLPDNLVSHKLQKIYHFRPWSHHRPPSPMGGGGFVLMFLGSPVMLKYESTCVPSFFMALGGNCKKNGGH